MSRTMMKVDACQVIVWFSANVDRKVFCTLAAKFRPVKAKDLPRNAADAGLTREKAACIYSFATSITKAKPQRHD